MNNTSAQPIEKVSIIISRGSLEGVYPGLIMANGARMEGIEASIFFTFFGLDAIIKKRMHNLKVATVGNPAMHMPTLLGALPGMSSFATSMMKRRSKNSIFPPSANSSPSSTTPAPRSMPARQPSTCFTSSPPTSALKSMA